MVVDEMVLGSYPRDDVWGSWEKDGKVREGTATVFVSGSEGRLERVGEVSLGRLGVVRLDLAPGAEVTVQLQATFGEAHFERTVRFTATGNEDDACVSAIGPGARAVPGGGLFKKTRYAGFEFGVLVMGATTSDGTVVGRSVPLYEHGPGDGVGRA